MANAAQEAVYAQYYNSVVQLAQKTDADGRVGVSRPELIHALGISRTVADALIARCKLRRSRTEGKTEFYSLSRGSKTVLKDAKETPVTDATTPSNPADPKGLVGAIVGDDQPAPTAQKVSKRGRNRLPLAHQEDSTASLAPATPAAPEAPAIAASGDNGSAAATLAPPVAAPAAVSARKSSTQLDQEITAIRNAMKLAGQKSEAAFQTYLAQKAHAEALGEKLKAALMERLSVG